MTSLGSPGDTEIRGRLDKYCQVLDEQGTPADALLIYIYTACSSFIASSYYNIADQNKSAVCR